MFHAVPHFPHQARPRASQLPPGEALVPCRVTHRLNRTLFYPEGPRNGTQAVPYGFAGGGILSSARVVFGTWYGDGSSPLHCVTPFNHTGYSCNVAGPPESKKAPQTGAFCVIPHFPLPAWPGLPRRRRGGRRRCLWLFWPCPFPCRWRSAPGPGWFFPPPS